MLRLNWLRRWLNALDPSTTTKIWTASFSGWHSGTFESFWTKKSALRYAEAHREGWQFVDVSKEYSKECVTVYHTKEPAPPVYVY